MADGSGSFKINDSIVRREKSTTKKETKSSLSHLFTDIPVLLPFGSLLCYWNTFLFLTLLYSIVAIPYSIAFEIIPTSKDPTAIIMLLIDICLLFDIILNFRTAYIDKYDRLRIIHDPKLIAKRYLSTWFMIELISSIPFTFIIVSTGINNDIITTVTFQYIRLFRIIKLLRVTKLFKTFYRFEEMTHSLYHLNRGQRTLLQLMKIIASMLLIAHYFACIWYSIGTYAYKRNHPSWIDTIVEYNDFNEGNFAKYSYAFYWSIVTLFTTGYGDIHANNIYEQWFASVGIIFGSCLFAYFIGVLTNGLNEDLNHQSSAERMEQSRVFCSYYDIPQELRRAVITHIKYFNDYNYAFNNEYIMNSLPNYLQKEIETHLKRSRLRGLDIFKYLPDEITGQIALKLKCKSCGVGKLLYNKGDIGSELFIQRTGKSELISESNKIREIHRGDVIGEDIILSKQRVNSIRCLTWSEFFVLDIHDIADILKSNYSPLEAKQKWIEIQDTIRKPLSQESSSDIINGQHKHFVRFNTLNNFEDYIPMEAGDSKLAHKNVIVLPEKNASYARHEEYERKLEQEMEAEEKRYKLSMENHKSMVYIVNMFGKMKERENSDLRNAKVVENHERNKKSAGYYVSSENINTNNSTSVINGDDTSLIDEAYFDIYDEITNHDPFVHVEMVPVQIKNGNGKCEGITSIHRSEESVSNSDEEIP